jgi:antitoxin VapB
MIQCVQTATQSEAMALNIRNRETEELAAALAEATGETKTEAVRRALAERLERVRLQRRRRSLVDEIGRIADHCTALPELDRRATDEILGYDDHGLPR